MTNLLSRMNAIQTPIIPVVAELIKNSPGTISLGQGVVYYSPPKEAIEALPLFSSNSNNHLYQPVIGISPLLEKLKIKLEKCNRIEINNHNSIVVTAGSNMAFMNTILAITSPGDEIILNTPYYFNHEMAIRMADCHPILVETDPNYQLIPETISQAITNKTRAIVTISPNNPTGVVYPAETLYEINEICRKNSIYHISDEAYEYFTYNGVEHISPGSFPHSNEYTISLFSLSKTYGFASWRIGYMVIPKHLLTAIKKVQDTILICPPVVSQYAALGALNSPDNYLKNHLENLAKVREIVLKSLQDLGDICTITLSEGAFYFFIKVHTEMEDMTLVKKLIEEYKIAVIPGSTFGMTNGCYLRVAYGALARETAQAGIKRLVEGVRKLTIDN